MSTVLEPATTSRPPKRLVTLDEYARLPDDGRLTELVRGRVAELPFSTPRHGQVCANAAYELTRFVDQHDRGHVLSNDTGVVTERDPDTLRGPDVAFYSFERVPRGPLPNVWLDVAPEFAFEVKSPEERWADLLEKIAEFLNAGVLGVVVLDPENQTAHVDTAAAPPRVFAADQTLELPAPLADFRVRVGAFFE